MLLDQIDDLTGRIDQVTSLLDEAIAAVPVAPGATASVDPDRVDPDTGEITVAPSAYPSAVERISALPGGGAHSARAVIAGIGLDMGVFGTAARLFSWAKVSSRIVQSGRRTGRARTGQGNPYLKAALGQMAMGAANTDTFLGARYRRLAKRVPKAKALAAIERSILVAIFHLLSATDANFNDLGADYHDRRVDTLRRTRNLVGQLEDLGHHVTLSPAA